MPDDPLLPSGNGLPAAAAAAAAAAVHDSRIPEGRPSAGGELRLLDRVRREIRVRRHSIRTESNSVDWIKRLIFFDDKRHPSALGISEVVVFLTDLALERSLASSTQAAQSKSAMLFLYRVVLNTALPWLDDVVAACNPRRLPVVLTMPEVRSVLGQMNGSVGLVCVLLYGTGLRLIEGLRVRVKYVQFSRRDIPVRNGKGGKGRVTVLPEHLIAPLQQQIVKARALHQRDLSEGFGATWLPGALDVKYPGAPKQWGWQWNFPSATRSADPLIGKIHRHHFNEASVQKAMSLAAKRAGIVKPCFPHILRHASATHVLNRGGRGVRSPFDRI